MYDDFDLISEDSENTVIKKVRCFQSPNCLL